MMLARTRDRLILAAACVSSACGAHRVGAPPNVDIMSMPAVCGPAPAGPSTPTPRLPSSYVTPDAGFATLVGVVADDPAGGALAGASVWARAVGHDSASRRTPPEQLADDAGGFAIIDLRPGTYELRVRRVGYVARTWRFTTRADAVDTLRVQLHTAPACRGY